MGISREFFYELEDDFKSSNRNDGLYILDIASSTEKNMTYALTPYSSKSECIQDLKKAYEISANGSLCDGIVVEEPGIDFFAERFFIEIKDSKIINQELMVVENKNGVNFHCQELLC